MAAPSHAARNPSLLQRLRRWAFWVLGIDFAALAALGIWLAFQYEPGGSGVSDLHDVLGVVAVVAALVAAVATVADDDRSTAGILPAIVVLGVIGAMYLTGPTLAWDRLAANGPVEDTDGITVVFDDDVGAVGRGDDEMTAQDYRRIAYLHALALPVAVLAMGGAGLWASRRRRRYQPQRVAEEPVTET